MPERGENLKLICLNIGGGKLQQPLLGFLNRYSHSVEVFCLQEVFDKGKSTREVYHGAPMDIFEQISKVLPNHVGYFAPSQDKEEGIATFVDQSLQVEDIGDIFVYRSKNAMENNDSKTLGRNLQYVQIARGSRRFLVANLHGLWNGQGKTDTQERIAQSLKVRGFLDGVDYPKILCGDFNLLPGTKSLALLEYGMTNLISRYGITSTRTSCYPETERYADYVLVSPEVKVKSFKVLPDEVSDHSPLELEFALG